MLTIAQMQAIKDNITPKNTRAKAVHVYNTSGTILLATFKTVNAFQTLSGVNGSDIKNMITNALL